MACYQVPSIYLQSCHWPKPPTATNPRDLLEWDKSAKDLFNFCHDLHNKFVSEYNANQ